MKSLARRPCSVRWRSISTSSISSCCCFNCSVSAGRIDASNPRGIDSDGALVILAIGLLWPYLSQLGLGRLPGDIVIERENMTLYFPLMTCLLLSVLFSLVFWVVNR